MTLEMIDGLAPDGTCRYCDNKVVEGEEDFHATTECALQTIGPT